MLQDLPIRAKQMFKTIRTVLEDLPIQPKKIFKQIRDISSWNDESCPMRKTKDVGEEKQNLPEKASDVGEENQNLPEKTAGPDLESIPEDVGEEQQNLTEKTTGPAQDSIPEGKGKCGSRRSCTLFPNTLKFVLMITTLMIQSFVPAAATDDNITAIILNIPQDTVVYGQTLEIECKIEEICMVTSWSVGKKSEHFETVLRENKTFDDSMKYGGNVVTQDNHTIYKLMIKSVNKLDEQYVYRCECCDLFKAGTITAINEKLRFLTVVNPSKKGQESSTTIDGWKIAIIVVILVALVVFSTIACVRRFLKNKSQSKYELTNNSLSTSSNDSVALEI